MNKSKTETHEYRGIEFWIGQGGCFVQPVPGKALRWLHWSRFFKQIELKALTESSTPMSEKKAIMERAIDRAFNDEPCYTGDIRDQMIPGKY